MISKLMYYLDTSTLKMLHYSLVLLHIKCCICACCVAVSYNLKLSIVDMQKIIVRSVFCVPAQLQQITCL